MNRFARYLVPFAAAAMLGGCGIKESFKDSEVQVARFHAALDAGQVQKIWTTADPDLRKSTRREDFEKLLDAVHRKLGKVTASKQVGWNANATNSGTFLTVTMQTTFENGAGTEQFVYRKGKGEGAPPTLVGYTIQSQDMMLN